MARDEDRCLNDDIQRVRERMVDDHNALKGEHQSILSAVRAGFRDMSTRFDEKDSDKSSNFNIYWMLGTVAVALIAAYARLRGA